MNQKTQTFKGFWDAFALLLVSSSAKCNTQRSSAQHSRALGGTATAIILLAFVVSLLGVSCSRSGLPGNVSGISFTASAGNPLTKGTTDFYSNTYYGGEGSVNAGKEAIYWSDGDIITIACAQADGLKTAHYSLVPNASDLRKAMVYPTPSLNPNGLQWGSGQHFFYAIYPSKEIAASDAKSYVSIAPSGILTAYIPQKQPLSLDASSTSALRKYNPVMKYLYLYAGARTAANADKVSLEFRPATTAFQFTVGGEDAEELILNSFTLSSTSCALNGEFKGKIAENGSSISFKSADGGLIPSASIEAARSVTVDLGGSVVSSSKKVVFTLFALPGSNISGKEDILTNLKISFNISAGSETFTRSLELKKSGNFVEYPGKKKMIFTLTLPNMKDCRFTITDVNNLDANMSDVAASDVDVLDMPDTDGGILW